MKKTYELKELYKTYPLAVLNIELCLQPSVSSCLVDVHHCDDCEDIIPVLCSAFFLTYFYQFAY